MHYANYYHHHPFCVNYLPFGILRSNLFFFFVNRKFAVWDFRFSQQCCWRIKSSGCI